MSSHLDIRFDIRFDIRILWKIWYKTYSSNFEMTLEHALHHLLCITLKTKINFWISKRISNIQYPKNFTPEYQNEYPISNIQKTSHTCLFKCTFEWTLWVWCHKDSYQNCLITWGIKLGIEMSVSCLCQMLLAAIIESTSTSPRGEGVLTGGMALLPAL